eukprot:Seg12982.3 transcript_id=Seg12982.3/GoldUCD/mRNA.D3Y31 product="hypothetical protein" protein_id=Seg12982.3/GoldUCD/D3Y31
MSLLSDFVKSGFKDASKTIGTKQFKIGEGGVINVVPSEANRERVYDGEGFDEDHRMNLVTATEGFRKEYPLEVKQYLGKCALLDGVKWRIRMISEGESFTSIELISTTMSS